MVDNDQCNKFSLDITQKFSYIKDGKTKKNCSSTYLNLTNANPLVNQLPLAYQLAKNLEYKQNVEIYNRFCLISKICYTFLHRLAASDC